MNIQYPVSEILRCVDYINDPKKEIYESSNEILVLNNPLTMKKKTKESFINIGSGIEKSITDFAKFIMKKLKVKLKINYDISKPNGMKRKILDLSISRKYGWVSKTSLDKSFDLVYQDFECRTIITQSSGYQNPEWFSMKDLMVSSILGDIVGAYRAG